MRTVVRGEEHTLPGRIFAAGGRPGLATRRCVVFVSGLLALGVWARAEEDGGEEISDAACLECHGEQDAEPFIDGQRFAASVHADNGCVSCHSDITEAEHDTPLAKVDCAECHDTETEIYLQSYHGKSLRDGRTLAESCRDCHGDAHQIVYSDDPASPVAHPNIPVTCAGCHGDEERMKEFNLRQLTPIVTYTGSVHGISMTSDDASLAAVCTDCHGTHDLHRSTSPDSKLYWRNTPDTCGKCHEGITKAFQRSVHGKAVLEGNKDAPVCIDCHGEHSIAAVGKSDSKVFPTHVAETCGQCHSAERIVSRYQLADHVVDTYMESYHGLAMRLGSVVGANCASCHGEHDILPSTDPRSSIHQDNLPETCGVCHAGMTDLVTKGKIHSGTPSEESHVAVGWVRSIYVFLFVVVLGGMLLHNAMDLIMRVREHFRKQEALGLPNRMTLSQRIQHAVLIVTFVSLAYTGFALKFPDSWWASLFTSEFDWRGYGHRVAAVLFCGLGIYHFWFILFTRRGRWEVRHLMIRFSDLTQFRQMMGHYLGLNKQPPRFGRYGYMEKMEYWALVWGSVVMAVTGALMTWEEWTLGHFPKWVFDVMTAIHYYEAILASFAVVIWHLYFVIVTPEEFPVKWTFLSGKASQADLHRLPPETPEPPSKNHSGDPVP